MDIEQVAEHLSSGRVIDLSLKMNPGSTEGPSAKPSRRYEIQKFEYEPWKIWSGPGETMHYVEMESHVSTHVEAPSHYIPARHGRSAPDLSELPLSTFFGSAVLIDCTGLEPQTPIGAEILREFPIQEGDIVLVGKGQHIGTDGDDRSFMTKEGVEYLLSKKVKLVAFDDTIIPENTQVMRDLSTMFTHETMLSNNIPIIERLANLEELTKTRFLFFAIPPKMGGIDSFPIRAMAIE
ncbi:MAG: cyclase family protein [Dehalococcoidales bacterium]